MRRIPDSKRFCKELFGCVFVILNSFCDVTRRAMSCVFEIVKRNETPRI